MRAIVPALLFLIATATSAHAVPLVGEAAQTCMNAMQYSNPMASHNAAQNYNVCPPMELTEAGVRYKSVRLEPGIARAPIDLYDQCYYLDNHSTESFFIPANTPQEWYAFLAARPGLVQKVQCCRQKTFNSVDTCGEDVPIDYGRQSASASASVGTEGRTLEFSCESGEWVLASTNGRACNATAAAAGGGAGDNGNIGFIRATDTTQQDWATLQGWAVQRNITN
jgi:hypothetical protein